MRALDGLWTFFLVLLVIFIFFLELINRGIRLFGDWIKVEGNECVFL